MEFHASNIRIGRHGPITRQDIMNFPFPYKLWLVVNLESCDSFRWNRDGTVLLLDLASLGEYLNSALSIFRIKNCSGFLQHMKDFRFERLNATPEAEEDVLLQYKHEHFQRHRRDLLCKIRRQNYEQLTFLKSNNIIPVEHAGEKKFNSIQKNRSLRLPTVPALAKEAAIDPQVATRMKGDLCTMSHDNLARNTMSRMHLDICVKYENAKRLLAEKMRNCNGTDDNDQVIEIPEELFENPHDSVLCIGEHARPEYAGYYGNLSKQMLSDFFGDYLPKYEDGSMEIKKANSDDSFPSTSGTVSAPSAVTPLPSYSIDIDPVALAFSNISSFSPQTENGANLSYSSVLEPIFNSEDEQIDVGANTNKIQNWEVNNFDTDDDICMEDFIKFKEPVGNQANEASGTTEMEHQGNGNGDKDLNLLEDNTYSNGNPQDTEVDESFSQMPEAVRAELAEAPIENEANFRNFCSQYKSTLHLLYERR